MFSAYFFVYESLFPKIFCTLSSGLDLSRKQKSGSLMVQQVVTSQKYNPVNTKVSLFAEVLS